MITNHRVLIGVFIPVALPWVEHLIECNWSRVQRHIAESESAMSSPDRTLAALINAEVVEELHAALNPAAVRSRESTGTTVLTVRIGDLSAELIERAGQSGQALAITHERTLVGMIIPVTQDLVQFLIDQNITRVLSNIVLSERHLSSDGDLTTLRSPDGEDEASSLVVSDS